MSQPNQTPQTGPQSAKPDPKADEAAKAAAAKAKAEAEAAAKAEAEELAFIGSPILLSPELVKVTAPQNARNARQVKMDETVKTLHAAWKRASGPSTWGAAVAAKVVGTYFLDPAKVADFKKLVTKAARLHSVTVRWGTSFLATPELVSKHGLPQEYTGREVLSFFVKDTRKQGNGAGPVTTTQGATAPQK